MFLPGSLWLQIQLSNWVFLPVYGYLSLTLGLCLVSLLMFFCVFLGLCLSVWTTPPGGGKWLIPHLFAAALGAATFFHFFLFLGLPPSSLAAWELRWDLGLLVLLGILGVPLRLHGPLRLDLDGAFRNLRRRGALL